MKNHPIQENTFYVIDGDGFIVSIGRTENVAKSRAKFEDGQGKAWLQAWWREQKKDGWSCVSAFPVTVPEKPKTKADLTAALRRSRTFPKFIEAKHVAGKRGGK